MDMWLQLNCNFYKGSFLKGKRHREGQIEFDNVVIYDGIWEIIFSASELFLFLFYDIHTLNVSHGSKIPLQKYLWSFAAKSPCKNSSLELGDFFAI